MVLGSVERRETVRRPEVESDKVQYCDVCCLQPSGERVWDPHAQPAIVDGPTQMGVHAYMCERHLQSVGYPKSRMNHTLEVK